MNFSDEYVIIVAGGIGRRMGASIPKQFIALKDKTILQHTIDAFYAYNPRINIILSLHPDYILYWTKLCEEKNISITYPIVGGGDTRFFSVKNALSEVKKNGFVAVHDAVRPLVSSAFLARLFSDARSFGSAIPVLPTKNSLRLITPADNIALRRSDYFQVQTPQVFQSEILIKGYEQHFRSDVYPDFFTDDASLVEHLGVRLHTSIGLEENIKITTALDLKLVALLLEEKEN